MIRGKMIVNFPWNKEGQAEQQYSLFDVTENGHNFLFSTENYPAEVAWDLFCHNDSFHLDYLFCVDENGEPFTLYDCWISLKELPVEENTKTVWQILWNRYLFGYHVQNENSQNIISAEYIIQTEKGNPSYRMFIGKNDFWVNDNTVHIKTDWYKENTQFNGVIICVDLKTPIRIKDVEKIVLRFLEILFLQVGFFPKVEKRKMWMEDNKTFLYWEEFAAYAKTAKRNIALGRTLEIKNRDYSSIYEKWWNIREKEVVTFNLFSYSTADNSPVREIPIATCIQCLEGYFRIHHQDVLVKFSDSEKKQIVGEIVKALSSSDIVKEICENNGISVTETINSIKGLTGNINRFSLRDVIQYSIERCDMTKKLFEYESSTVTANDKTVLDIFLSKAKGHRDWLSHITPQTKRFVNEQMPFATDKLKMLFRLSLMYDIGMEVKEESLNSRIDEINQWYKDHDLV